MGTLIATIRRLTVVFLPMVVVFFSTTIVISTSPHRPALPGEPVNDFATVEMPFRGTVLMLRPPARASAPGKASAAAVRTTTIDLRIGLILSGSGLRSGRSARYGHGGAAPAPLGCFV